MTADWLIAGGGVGGLTLAVVLTRLGANFVVVEQDQRTAGAGLLLASSAMRVLSTLGVAERALQSGQVTRNWHILNQAGSVLRKLSVNSDLPSLSIQRADLLALLRTQLPVDSVVAATVDQVQAQQDGVAVTLKDGRVLIAKALIGADGMRSCVRRHLFGEQCLRYRGYVGWRGIARLVPDGYKELLSESWGPGGRFGIAPVDENRTYWYASANHPESWIDHAQERQTNLLRRFAEWHKPVQDLIAATPNDEILVNRIYDLMRLPAWSKGKITLLGDAAHAMTPNLGQGACLAIEDAWELGSLIALHANPELAMANYERARMRRVRWIQQQSRAMGWVVQAERPVTVAVREWITPRIPDFLVRFGMRKLFEYG